MTSTNQFSKKGFRVFSILKLQILTIVFPPLEPVDHLNDVIAEAIANDSCRDAADNRKVRDIMRHHCIASDNRPVANFHIVFDHRVTTDPHVMTDRDASFS